MLFPYSSPVGGLVMFSSTLLTPLHIPASASNSKSWSMQRCWQSNKESGVETFRINFFPQDTRQGEPLHHVRVLSIKRFTVNWNVSYRNNAACLSLSFADKEIMQSMDKTPPSWERVVRVNERANCGTWDLLSRHMWQNKFLICPHPVGFFCWEIIVFVFLHSTGPA